MNDNIIDNRLNIISSQCRSMIARLPYMQTPKRELDRYCERTQEWDAVHGAPEVIPAETVRRMLAAIAKIAEAEDSEALNHALVLAEEHSKVKMMI